MPELLHTLKYYYYYYFLQAEKKHKNFQELDRFMHYYTRFKNHEHSYQVKVYKDQPDFTYDLRLNIIRSGSQCSLVWPSTTLTGRDRLNGI